MASLSSRLTTALSAAVIALALSACSDSSDTAVKAEAPAPSMETTASVTPVADEATAATTSSDTVELAQADTAAGTEAAGTEAAGTEAAPAEAPEVRGEVDMDKVLAPGPLDDKAIGEENAPVTVVEYMSMTCPHCRQFHEETYPALKEKYIDTGKVRFVLREFPLDPRAAAAIMLARCAPNDQFFPMVDVLFKRQTVWATAQDARTELLNIAKLAGFTQESFEACLTNQQLLDDVNSVRTTAGEDFGVDATPTFFIDGKRYSGDMSIGQMSAIIDPLL
jgi:protein-disulfide isomerase